jgi:hypothetical protein
VGGRLERGELTIEEKHPVILPGHHVTTIEMNVTGMLPSDKLPIFFLKGKITRVISSLTD